MKWREITDGCGCWLVLLILIGAIVYLSSKNEKEKDKRKQRQEFVTDSIARRMQYVKDSIDSVEKSPEYIAYLDSLRIERKKEQERQDRNTVVMVCDRVYHYKTECLDISDMTKVRIMSKYDADSRGYEECSECDHVDEEEYIYFEDVLDYVNDHYSKSDLIDYFGIDGSDFYDEREYDNSEPWAPARVR